MSDGSVVHVRISARRPARAARFYADCFGWTLTGEDPQGARFTTPGGLTGSFWKGGEPSSAGPELYVEVRGLEAVIARAVALGGMRIARPGPGPAGSRVAQLLDPEGNRICLWEAPIDPEAIGKDHARPDGIADSHE